MSVVLQVDPADLEVGPLLHGHGEGLIELDLRFFERGLVEGDDLAQAPFLIRGQVDQDLQGVLVGPDRGFGGQDAGLAGGDVGLGGQDVERGHRPDLDRALVIGQEIFRKLQAETLDLEVLDAVDQAPVGLDDRVDRALDGVGERELGGLVAVAGDDDVPVRDLGPEVPEEGLVVAEAQAGSSSGG